MPRELFQIHGDNIVECVRALDYVVAGLGDAVAGIAGPLASVTCPLYRVQLHDRELQFQLIPGYGERRWNQDILGYVARTGGRLREAADAILTRVADGREVPVAAIEFCGALPAGNQAWQRQGRAFSFAQAKISYFYVAELGGFELAANRARKAERLPNPAVPFSFFAMTQGGQSLCLPVYEANAGAKAVTAAHYGPIYGKAELLEFLCCAVAGGNPTPAAARLGEKCLALVQLLAGGRKRQDGLTAAQWQQARDALASGKSLLDYLSAHARLAWGKIVSVKSLTPTAQACMAVGAAESFGLTSARLPLSFVPKERRPAFAKRVGEVYPELPPAFAAWLAQDARHLAIAWVNGFKPRGDDARPDRGLPPLARMLAGEAAEVLTFVYGPAPASHWHELARNPVGLARRNGLWEAILGVSDGVLADAATQPAGTPRAFLKDQWAAVLAQDHSPLLVEPVVRVFGEQDVDTALRVAFESLGPEIAFEGMCNPPGGDWSGLSFRWDRQSPEHRWLTLPRVSAEGAKRPDHVFAVYGHGEQTICLCIESKEAARALEVEIGPRLIRYARTLLASAPSILRQARLEPWALHAAAWAAQPVTFLSAGAYLGTKAEPFRGLPAGTQLDLQIGVVFLEDGRRCELYLRGDSAAGESLADYLLALGSWGDLVTLHRVSN